MSDPAPDVRKDGTPTLQARGYSRPPFKPGHTLSVRSGAWSPRFVTETMEELRPQLQAIIDDAPWCRPVDELALLDFLRDMARAERLERWLHDHGDRYPATDKKRGGELRERDLRELGALRNRLLAHRARLGLDPASRARLAVDRALGPDLAQAMAALAAAASQDEEHGDDQGHDEAGDDADEKVSDERMPDTEPGALLESDGRS